MTKKQVRCTLIPGMPIVLGYSAYINTVDHPDLTNQQVERGKMAQTSPVQTINEDGSFETLNTHYIVVGTVQLH